MKSLARTAARPAFDWRSTDPPQTSTTAGPLPSLSKAIVVPSAEVVLWSVVVAVVWLLSLVLI